MKTEDLKEKGLTEEQIQFVMAENGKDLKKLQKENGDLTAERDNWKEKAETAEETLKKFDGVDLETMQTELADWKKKAEDAEEDYKQKIYERDFSDALKASLDEVKFSSDAAKKAISDEIKNAGLKLSDGKILGLNDLLSQIKERDASAFVDEEKQQAQQKAARFTTAGTGRRTDPGDHISMSELMKMKNENPGLDISQYIKK